MCSLWLPVEVWALVFRHLSLSDRLRLRAACKYFRDLVDNGSLWRDWTVELRMWSFDDYDEESLWSTVRRWRVTSARVISPHSLTHVANEFSLLTTLTINICVEKILDLVNFTYLECLDVTSGSCLCLKDLSPFLPQCLTHLRVCQPDVNTPNLSAEIPPDFPFTKLKSLAVHCFYDSHPVNVLLFFLSSLPQLQHLSLKMSTDASFKGDISDLTPLHDCALSSLELVKCETRKFPNDLMKMLSSLPFLRSLAIYCHYTRGFHDDSSQKLSAWLRDLPALTSLLVKCSDIGGFVRSIPCSVTRLVLIPLEVIPWFEIMSALSQQLPNLRHLHLQTYEDLGSDTALIPRFFPRLKTLRLFHEQVPEDAFLSLASLKELEILETLDMPPLPAALVSKLRELTNYRVQIDNKNTEEAPRAPHTCSTVEALQETKKGQTRRYPGKTRS